jgi:hypothetical protein
MAEDEAERLRAAFDLAKAAGDAAARGWVRPFRKASEFSDLFDVPWHESAWVRILDRQSDFAQWLRREGLAERRWTRIEWSESGPLVGRGEARAVAFAEVLKQHGIGCVAGAEPWIRRECGTRLDQF